MQRELLSARIGGPARLAAVQEAPQQYPAHPPRVGGQFLQSLGLERYLAAFRDKLWRRVSVCLSLRQTDLPQSLGDAIEHRGRMDKRSHDL
jgi:hypothetical protein